MKKTFTLFFALVASVGTIFAATKVKIGGLYYNLNVDSKTAELTYASCGHRYYYPDIYCGLSGDDTNNYLGLTTANIPASVVYNAETYSVNSIGKYAFHCCGSLTSVDIPHSVTRIEEAAFANCESLVSINIPNSVTKIGDGAFGGCDGLTSIEIPNSVTKIGDGAFISCDGLTSIEIPNSVTSIGHEAFKWCRGLTSVKIGNSVQSIGNYAFQECSSLTSITIPNSVTGIAQLAFKDCTSLTSVTIGNGVEFISLAAFSGCSRLSYVSIGNRVISIHQSAFYDCSSLTSITLPASVQDIYQEAFYRCTGLISMKCYATNPPDLEYYGIGENQRTKMSLYVPVGSVEQYKSADTWKEFGSILPISATDTETTDIKATPTENSVDVIWTVITGAAIYELVIKDKDGKIVCTLIFNAQGQLMSIAFNAPSRDGAPLHTQTTGFFFTVTGLEPGTEYDLTITAKNESGQVLDKKNMSFHTNWPNGIEDIHVDSDKPVKVLMDGQIYILRGEHVYDAEGKMVK